MGNVLDVLLSVVEKNPALLERLLIALLTLIVNEVEKSASQVKTN